MDELHSQELGMLCSSKTNKMTCLFHRTKLVDFRWTIVNGSNPKIILTQHHHSHLLDIESDTCYGFSIDN